MLHSFKNIQDALQAFQNAAVQEATRTNDAPQKIALEKKRKGLLSLQKNVVELKKFIDTAIKGGYTKQAAETTAQNIHDFLQGGMADPVAALKNNTFDANINKFCQLTEAFKRNHELKAIMDDHMKKLKTTNQQAYDKAAIEIKDLLAEENRMMGIWFKDNSFADVLTQKINRKWAELLKRVFNVQGLPELKESSAAKNPWSKWGQGFFNALSGLFKTLKDPTQDPQPATMNFMGSMMEMVIGLFANLFKPFLGKNADHQIQDLTQNASAYFKNAMGNAYKNAAQSAPAPQNVVQGQGPVPAAVPVPQNIVQGQQPPPVVANNNHNQGGSAPAVIPSFNLHRTNSAPAQQSSNFLTSAASTISSAAQSLFRPFNNNK